MEEQFTSKFNGNANLKQIIALTLPNTRGLYFVLKYFSFIFTTHLAYSNTRL
jgi:hypothetical protein